MMFQVASVDVLWSKVFMLYVQNQDCIVGKINQRQNKKDRDFFPYIWNLGFKKIKVEWGLFTGGEREEGSEKMRSVGDYLISGDALRVAPTLS